MQVIACPSNCFKCWSTCRCVDRKHLRWALGGGRKKTKKTVIRREQTVAITAVKEAPRLSGCERRWPAVRRSRPSWRGVRGLPRLGGSASRLRLSPREGLCQDLNHSRPRPIDTKVTLRCQTSLRGSDHYFLIKRLMLDEVITITF